MHWVFAVATLLLTDADSGVEREARSYDLRFLVEEIPQFPTSDWPSAGGLLLDSSPLMVESVEGAPISFTESDEADEGIRIGAQSIVKLIRQNIAEDSWANERNSIDLRGAEMVVVQVPGVHEEIARLLARLRARRARMFAIDVTFVPVDALSDGDDIPGGGLWLTDEAFAAALKASGERAHRMSLTAYNEQTVSGLSGRRRTTVIDTEVNQTGVIPVVNPVVQSLPLGVSVEVQPRAIAGTDWARLYLKVARVAEAGKVEKRRTFFADIEFVPLREESLTTRLLLDSRRAVLAGHFRDSPVDGESRDYAVLVRMRRTDLEAPRDPVRPAADSFQLRQYDAGFLLEPPGPRRETLYHDPDLLVELLKANVSPEAWRDDRTGISVEEGVLHVRARRSTQDLVAKWIAEQVRELAVLATVELRIFEGPLEDILEVRRRAESDLLLSPDWREGEPGSRLLETFRGLAVGTVGTEIVARGFAARTYVADVVTASGGTGFTILEMPDPIVHSAGNGFTFRTILDRVPGQERVQLEIRFERCSTEFRRTAEFLASTEVGGSGVSLGLGERRQVEFPVSRPSRVELPYIIDLPRQAALRCRSAVSIPAGRPVILKVERLSEESGRMVVVTAGTATAIAKGGES